MTRIRATCPECGEVDLRPDDIELMIVGSDIDEVGDGSRYRFSCPDCSQMVSKPADKRIARLLATGGVAICHRKPDVDTSRVEAALSEFALLLNHPENPPLFVTPLSNDDVIDLHLQLTADGWFEELVRR